MGKPAGGQVAGELTLVLGFDISILGLEQVGPLPGLHASLGITFTKLSKVPLHCFSFSQFISYFECPKWYGF